MSHETLRLYDECLRLHPRSRLELIDGLLRHLDETAPPEIDYTWRRLISFRSGHWQSLPSPAEIDQVRRELRIDAADTGGTG